MPINCARASASSASKPCMRCARATTCCSSLLLSSDLPFAYSSNGDCFIEHDFITGQEREIALNAFPSTEELLSRIHAAKPYDAEQLKIVEQPYYFDQYTNEPRYYQRIAINRTIEAVAQGRNRMLLVMATGTGKTFTAFQIIHRLTKSGAKKKVLYLADRNVLIDQTMVQDFRPFKKVMTKIQNKNLDPSYEIYMAFPINCPCQVP